MEFQRVYIESLGFTLPQTVVSSDQLENQLQPLYERLKLPEGRLELMTGIKERRFWPLNTSIADISVSSCRQALQAAGMNADRIGLLIHGSVCRDHLEPATACRVHCELGLPKQCMIYDVSNACLGILNGMLQAANMIELGHIEAALVVGSENGCGLVSATVDALNNDLSLTRKSIKQSIASLTIGSASCAVLMTGKSLSKSNSRLLHGVVTANTQHHKLCQSLSDQAGGNMQPLMDTDSETMMLQGVETGRITYERLLEISGWKRPDINHTFCHQVGSTHRKLMLESIQMPTETDYSTFPFLGNTGSAALPITFAHAITEQRLSQDEKLALLGIGSGINSVMMTVDWQNATVQGCEKDSFGND